MLEQLVNILSCPHSSVLRLLTCIQTVLEDGINNYCWAFLWHSLTAVISKSFPDLHVPIHAYKIVGPHGIFTVTLQRERKMLSWFTGEEVRLIEVQVTSFGLVWDCELTQNYSNLFSFRVQQSLKLHVSLKLQVLSALVSYIASAHCCVWRSEKSVIYSASFVFNDLLSSSQSVQGSSRAEPSSPVQYLAIWTRTCLLFFLPESFNFVKDYNL